jgi:hypothetical protein
MDEARRVGPTAPQGQKRILAIDHPLVYRLRHGRWRRATWLEDEAARFWLLAGAQRAAGSHSDAYEVFVALHAAGELLPNDDDRLRDVFERDARVLTAARAEAPPALVAAAAAPETDVVIRFGELVDARVLVSAAGDEVWVAIATRPPMALCGGWAPGVAVRDPLRGCWRRCRSRGLTGPRGRSSGLRSRAWAARADQSGLTPPRRSTSSIVTPEAYAIVAALPPSSAWRARSIRAAKSSR